MNIPNPHTHDDQPHLRRALGLPLLLLFGIGVTVGGGIYVLVGKTALEAGIHAPAAFLFAALVMAPTTLSFAELSGRYPVSAGEAAYVRAGFNSKTLALLTGSLVAFAGTIAAAAITVGSVGYVRQFIDLPDVILVPVVIILIGLIAAWGILESVVLASIFTVIELAGLFVLIIAGFFFNADIVARLPEVVPTSLDATVWAGVLSAGLLSFFAFIGFQDIVNVAEEVRLPAKTMPKAIFLTLGITTVLYILVAAIAVLAVPPAVLGHAEAPLSLVYTKLTGAHPALISAIAIIAVFNTTIIQLIMASRVCYGMASQGVLPAQLASVHPKTRTPVIATAAITAIVLILAMVFPLQGLAEATSIMILLAFCLVNAALIRIKWKNIPAPEDAFVAPIWVPMVGLLVSLFYLFS